MMHISKRKLWADNKGFFVPVAVQIWSADAERGHSQRLTLHLAVGWLRFPGGNDLCDTDRWLSNCSWLKSNKHAAASPSLVHMIELLHVAACGLDITAQDRFLKCAPSSFPLFLLPPPPISSVPKQKPPLWENHSALSCTHIRFSPCPASLFTNCRRTLQPLHDSSRCLKYLKWLVATKECESNFPQGWGANLIALAEEKGQRPPRASRSGPGCWVK